MRPNDQTPPIGRSYAIGVESGLKFAESGSDMNLRVSIAIATDLALAGTCALAGAAGAVLSMQPVIEGQCHGLAVRQTQ